MSNGARHALGVVAGLLLPPLIAVALWYGVGQYALPAASNRISWSGLGALAGAGVVLAFLAGSRLSPVASLLGGLALTGAAVLPVIELAWGLRVLPDGLLPAGLETGYRTAGVTGVQLIAGVTLLVASAFPSRWRGRPEPVHAPSYAPELIPYQQVDTGPEDTTRPMFRE
ncbi:MAG TPA: hypothetical protein VFV66_31450 [Nonomuraea sp.]|nr:hypothetical protein [Nonomuraea sp.]